MRVTNNMIMSNTKININGNKTNVNTLNNQMTSQKKISRPSDDPVIAIRALRLRSSLSQINQYYEKNIPDAINHICHIVKPPIFVINTILLYYKFYEIQRDLIKIIVK